jgi:curved DNA-binding protein CbpA
MSKNLSDDFELDDIINKLRKSVEKNKEKKGNKKQEDSDMSDIHHQSDKTSESKKKDNDINQEKKMRNELFGSGVPDYYKIIGVSPSDSQETINKKCNQKLAEYHHDKIKAKLQKYPPEERKKQQLRYEAQYELIREAREYLSNPEKRKYYDLQKKTSESSSFVNTKDSFDKFIKMQDSEMTEENKNLAISTYKQKSIEMDKKHGFDSDLRCGQKDYHIGKDEFKRRLDDIETQRTQQDADCLPKNMFVHGGFNNKEFNRQWDMMQKKKEKKKNKKEGDRSIIQWDGIAAYNDHGASGGNYMALGEDDNTYEGLYKTSKEEDYMYSTKLGSDDEESISSFDSDLMNDIDVSYVDNFDKDKGKTIKSYEQMLKERELDTTKFENKQFDSWKDVTTNPFNISHQIGEVVGEDITNKKTAKSKKEMYEAYKALLYNKDK